MNLATRRTLLEHFAELTTEADVSSSPKVFLPLPRHRLALRTDIIDVLGARGAGKTAMFRLVRTLGPKLRDLYQDRQIPEATWVDGFDEALEHPHSTTLDALSVQFPQDISLRAFWMAHLLGRARPPNSPPKLASIRLRT